MGAVSVIVITLNEERNIDRCLASCAWADEIIVVDSFSTDGTVEHARRYTENVYQHEFPGSSRQVERGISYASCPWVFYIDADEEVTPELAADIRRAVEHRGLGENQPVGYEILRKSQAFGRWIEHGGWFPDYTFRLFRKDLYDVNHQEVHGGFTVRGPRGRLESLLLHYTYDSVFSYVDKMNDYTSLQVSNKLRETPDLRVGWTHLILHPLSHFVRMFLTLRGYRDGWHGFMLSLLDATYTMLLYMKIREYQLRRADGGGVVPPITNAELNKVKRSR
jgi:glycosyltransferase involved in cell wall biosynthesis